MNTLEEIADAKVRAAITRRLDSLNVAMIAIVNEMNSRGILSSSVPVLEIHKKWISLFDEILEDMKIEYGVVLDNAFWPTETLSNSLIFKARLHFESLTEQAKNEIKSATRRLLNSNMHEQLVGNYTEASNRALTDLSLYFDGHTIIRKRKKISSIVKFLPNLISKFFKS